MSISCLFSAAMNTNTMQYLIIINSIVNVFIVKNTYDRTQIFQ